MLSTMTILLDVLIVAFAIVSAWLWWLASGRRLRRVSRHEVLDASDLNRIVTALNRTQILNARAALTTACAALLGAARVCLSAWAAG
jgi:hypothetical protein